MVTSPWGFIKYKAVETETIVELSTDGETDTSGRFIESDKLYIKKKKFVDNLLKEAHDTGIKTDELISMLYAICEYETKDNT